jgi:uncharacterized 2Fe-2S/4Fe-4S cluster protein (DUF4445 family)
MITFTVEAGTVLTDGAGGNLHGIRMDCGGRGICGKCRIIGHPPAHLAPPTEAERGHLRPEALEAGHRLACQTHFVGPAEVTVPDASLDPAAAMGKDRLPPAMAPDPALVRCLLDGAAPPRILEGTATGLLEWIARRASESGIPGIRFPHLSLARQLSRPGAAEQALTLVVHRRRGVTTVWPGRRTRSLGMALDVGTTTLAAYLCDLTAGRTVAGLAALNPQRGIGEDVISRIAHCDGHPNGLDTLQGQVRDGLNRLMGVCLARAGASVEDVDAVTVAANPTMAHLLAGLHPHAIGVSPYLPAARRFPPMTAADLDLDLSPGTPVEIFPLVSGFLGGDTVAAVLADGTQQRDGTTLLVDIGTNGEIVLGRGGVLWATSCATGPALEGARISSGMRAVPGAVDRVTFESGRIGYHVMGGPDRPPLGLCGSGVIDAVWALYRAGALGRDGRFNPDYPGVVCDTDGLGCRFVLAASRRSGSGAEIALTQRDVRQVQLAKAAVAVGIAFLMRRAGVARVERTVLTGAFGARFDWRSAVGIGMLPAAEAIGAVQPRDNLAGVGAVMALIDRHRARQVRRIQEGMRFVEMAGDPQFNAQFVAALPFPEPAGLDEPGRGG